MVENFSLLAATEKSEVWTQENSQYEIEREKKEEEEKKDHISLKSSSNNNY